MNILTICPCCSNPMLHHFGDHREYWFCRNCWQEMPDLESKANSKVQSSLRTISLSTRLRTLIEQH